MSLIYIVYDMAQVSTVEQRSNSLAKELSDFQKIHKMEEPCLYSKYGFCKFKEKCRRKHYSEVCHHLETCKSTKTCEKRHPKKCKRYNTEKGCRFGSECGYHHSEQHDDNKTCECKAKIDILEKIATEITSKIIDHENKLDNMKTLYPEHGELKEKLNLCEAVIQKMFMNIIKLEAEVKDLKTIIRPSEGRPL